MLCAMSPLRLGLGTVCSKNQDEKAMTLKLSFEKKSVSQSGLFSDTFHRNLKDVKKNSSCFGKFEYRSRNFRVPGIPEQDPMVIKY